VPEAERRGRRERGLRQQASNRGHSRSASGAAGYGRGAAILSVGIGVTGLVTYAYFALASHTLSEADYGRITLLWSSVFVTVSVLYRPVEQLLSRTIADRAARGAGGRSHLRVAGTIQLVLGVAFAVVALAARGPIEDDLFGGSETLYWVLIVTVLAYAVSYFARGFLAGSHRFGLYGGLVLMEATSRCLFALAVAVGIASGQEVVALGIAAAPIVSLAVVPWALGRRLPPPVVRASATDVEAPSGTSAGHARGLDEREAAEARALDEAAAGEPGGEPEFTLAHGTGFAVSVLLIMLAEQTFLNAGPLLVKATEGAEGAALAGFTFNVLLIARAPLQLFQAVQTSILPHLTRLRASGDSDPFRRSVEVTLMAIAAFAGCVAVVMLAAGPTVMDLVFGGELEYDRGGLVLISLGMGLYLAAATLNQALLARARARTACACWLAAAAGFVGFLLLPGFDDRVLQVEVGYAGAALVLFTLLYAVYHRSH
jgi:O-antigen/teichoic acid export membrane protein